LQKAIVLNSARERLRMGLVGIIIKLA